MLQWQMNMVVICFYFGSGVVSLPNNAWFGFADHMTLCSVSHPSYQEGSRHCKLALEAQDSGCYCSTTSLAWSDFAGDLEVTTADPKPTASRLLDYLKEHPLATSTRESQIVNGYTVEEKKCKLRERLYQAKWEGTQLLGYQNPFPRAVNRVFVVYAFLPNIILTEASIRNSWESWKQLLTTLKLMVLVVDHSPSH